MKMMDAPPGNHYTEAELSPFGALREIPEGTGVEFDAPVEGHKKVIYYTAFGLDSTFFNPHNQCGNNHSNTTNS